MVVSPKCHYLSYYLKDLQTPAGEDETCHDQNICARALYDYQACECLNSAVLSKNVCIKLSLCSKVLNSAMSCNIWNYCSDDDNNYKREREHEIYK